MNYILNENKTQILIEGNWYDIYNDLKKVEPTWAVHWIGWTNCVKTGEIV